MHLRCTYDAPKMHLSRRSVVVFVAPRLYPHPYPQHECSSSCRRLLHPPPLSSPLTAVLTRGPRARVLVVVLSSSPPPRLYPHPRPSENECWSSCRRLLHPPPRPLTAVLTRGLQSASARRRAVVFSTPRLYPHPPPLGARVLVAVVFSTPPPLSSPLSSPAALGARVLVVVPSSSRRLWGNTWGNAALE